MDTYSVRLLWSDSDEGYIATSPEFAHLSAFGTTAAEAIAELESVIRFTIEEYRESGWPLPRPARVREHSGQLRLRLPKSLHGRLVEEADRDGVSLNTLIVTYLAQQVGRAASAVSASDPRRPVKHLRAMPVEE